MPIPAIVGLGLGLLPKLPQLWDTIASIFGKEAPQSVQEAAQVAQDVGSMLARGEASPEQVERVQLAMLAHKVRIRELEIEEQRLENEDRASARQRDVQAQDRTPRDLAFIIVPLAFLTAIVSAVVMYLVPEMPAVVAAMIGSIVGYAFSEAKQVSTYYYGSSRDSDQKTNLLYSSQPAGQREAQ